MTTTTIVRADWSNVTLAEYAAVRLLSSRDAVRVIDTARQDTYPPAGGLNSYARAWLAELRERVTTTTDEHDIIAAARECVRMLGTLTVMRAGRHALALDGSLTDV